MKTKHDTPWKDNGLSSFKKKQKLEGYFTKALKVLGMDLEDDSLKDTPRRMAKMWVDEIFTGLNPESFPKMTTVDNKMGNHEPVILTNITLNSNCEHHFVPIIGVCHIAYRPGKKILGLSKFNRLVQYYGKRPQIQERLTLQIADKLRELLGTEDIAVVIDAVHTCVRTRGVQDVSSLTRTSILWGSFGKGGEDKESFLSSIPKAIEFKL